MKCELGDVAEIVGGGTPSTSILEYWNGEINWYSPVEIGNQIYVSSSQNKITKLGLEKSSAKILPAYKTILFTSRAGIGNTAIMTTNGATNQGFQSLVIKEKTDLYFLYSISSKIKEMALQIASGSTFLEISGKSLSRLEILVPNFEEQTKIGKFFQHLDNLITVNERELNKLKNLKKSYLEKMFPKNGSNIPELRFSGYTDAWVKYELSELAKFSKGRGYSKSDLVKAGYPIILYGRLYTNYETTISTVTDTFVSADLNSIKSEIGDVIVPGSGETAEDISRASTIDISGIILGGDLNIIKPDKQVLDSIFLAITISNGSQQRELTKRAQGKSVVHLHNSDLERILVYLPSKNEQTKIGNFFTKLDKVITVNERELKKLKELKKSYLNDMFV